MNICFCIYFASLLGVFIGSVLSFVIDDLRHSFTWSFCSSVIFGILAGIVFICFNDESCCENVNQQYAMLLQKEEFEQYEKADKDNIAKFKSAYIDKCVNLSSELKDKALVAYKEAAFASLKAKQKNNVKSDYFFANTIATQDETLNSENYISFLKHASKISDFRSFKEGNAIVLEFSYKDLVPLDGCICGKCKKTVVNTFSIEIH